MIFLVHTRVFLHASFYLETCKKVKPTVCVLACVCTVLVENLFCLPLCHCKEKSLKKVKNQRTRRRCEEGKKTDKQEVKGLNISREFSWAGKRINSKGGEKGREAGRGWGIPHSRLSNCGCAGASTCVTYIPAWSFGQILPHLLDNSALENSQLSR